MQSKRRIVDDELYCHFVTFSVHRRRRMLDHDQPKRIVLAVLNRVLVEHTATCVGFVVMPNHVHAVVWFPATNQLSPFMHEWKRQSSLEIRKWYREVGIQYQQEFEESGKFWQPKYYSFSIDRQAKLQEKLDYMHANPIRAGFVEQASDWPWSSARWYKERRSVGVPLGWVE